MDRDELQRVVAALVMRVGTGVCRISPQEMAKATVDKLRIATDRNGDIWLDFKEHAPADDDTWPVDE
jgi:hypothetical protein